MSGGRNAFSAVVLHRAAAEHEVAGQAAEVLAAAVSRIVFEGRDLGGVDAVRAVVDATTLARDAIAGSAATERDHRQDAARRAATAAGQGEQLTQTTEGIARSATPVPLVDRGAIVRGMSGA